MLSLFRFCQFWMEDELEWLVQSILGTSLEDLFIICLTKFLTQFLDSACDVIITHVLLILDERYLFWMKGKMRWLVPSILGVLLENSFTICRKEFGEMGKAIIFRGFFTVQKHSYSFFSKSLVQLLWKLMAVRSPINVLKMAWQKNGAKKVRMLLHCKMASESCPVHQIPGQ